MRRSAYRNWVLLILIGRYQMRGKKKVQSLLLLFFLEHLCLNYLTCKLRKTSSLCISSNVASPEVSIFITSEEKTYKTEVVISIPFNKK